MISLKSICEIQNLFAKTVVYRGVKISSQKIDSLSMVIFSGAVKTEAMKNSKTYFFILYQLILSMWNILIGKIFIFLKIY